jgi:hypothetical protein
MNTQIKCPHCHQSFEPTDAFKHELEEKVLRETQLKHQTELEEVRKQAIEKARLEAQEGALRELKDKEEQITQLKKRAELAEEQELIIRKEKRDLEEAKRKFELDKQRQLDEEREKIRVAAVKEAEDKTSLILAQEKKKNDDAQKQILELQRKLQQGSQQSQGEVMELELEALLRREFPSDRVSEVKKGVRGADVVQEVIDKNGQNCGAILWESKNAKWSQSWISVLKENKRQANAQIAVLVSTDTPPEIETFAYRDGVWIATRKMALPLALALRFDLVRVSFEKTANTNKSDKAAILYQYITSTGFQHRIESLVETFSEMQTSLEAEKRWFTLKWAKQEKQVRRVFDNIMGMRGDLEDLVGNALPAAEYAKLPEHTIDEDLVGND